MDSVAGQKHRVIPLQTSIDGGFVASVSFRSDTCHAGGGGQQDGCGESDGMHSIALADCQKRVIVLQTMF